MPLRFLLRCIGGFSRTIFEACPTLPNADTFGREYVDHWVAGIEDITPLNISLDSEWIQIFLTQMGKPHCTSL
jgi:hypothetical protein